MPKITTKIFFISTRGIEIRVTEQVLSNTDKNFTSRMSKNFQEYVKETSEEIKSEMEKRGYSVIIIGENHIEKLKRLLG